LQLGASVNSGDYSGGSHSSNKKANLIPKDIEMSDIAINDFKKGKGVHSNVVTSKKL